MKIQSQIALSLAVPLMIGTATLARAGIFSNDTMDMIVVAEAPYAQQASAGTPLSYLAFDGGYIEAGDPIGGESPPSPDQVGQAFRSAVAQVGFRQSPVSPSAVLTYHWGVIRRDREEARMPYTIKPNLVARIELVGTQEMSGEVENHLLLRKKGSLTSDAASPKILVGPEATVLQNAKVPRYFVIVSAYDYQGLLRHETKLLWRVKLSAQDKEGPMDQVIPALLAGGAPYFGKNLTDVPSIKVSLRAAPQVSGAPASEASAGSGQLDGQVIQALLKGEHGTFSGTAKDNSSS
jgi:hypothetical protein